MKDKNLQISLFYSESLISYHRDKIINLDNAIFFIGSIKEGCLMK